MYGGDEREQREVAKRWCIRFDGVRLQEFCQDAVGRVRAVGRAAAGAQIRDQIGNGRKCGLQGTRTGELAVTLLTICFGGLLRKTAFQAADEAAASRFSAHHGSPWRSWMARHW